MKINDYKELVNITIEKPNQALYERIQRNFDAIAKPLDGLGIFEKHICKIGAILNEEYPNLNKKALAIMIADNGVVSEGVSQCGKEVTYDVAKLMGINASSVGTMAKAIDPAIKFIPVDVGIDSDEHIQGVIDKKIRRGTENITCREAMTGSECLAAINVGIELVKSCHEDGITIIATGEMGIGNTTTSTAVLCALTGCHVTDIAGRGAGLSDEGLKNKIEVINRAIDFHISGSETAFEILCKLGGLDIAGLTGVFIGGAIYHIPIVIDGFISSVAALCAQMIIPGCSDYMLASHAGREKGTLYALDKLDLTPVIHADMALGEGTGAIMLFPLIEMALALYIKGTEFNDTKIDSYQRFT